jgi:hypothetical protein
VVDQDIIPLFAGSKYVSSLEVADMVPVGSLFFRKPVDGIDVGLGFQEPESGWGFWHGLSSIKEGSL